MTTTEKNTIIDKFLNRTVSVNQYNENWNELMLVVKKVEQIEESDFTVYINNDGCKISGVELYPYLHIVELSTTKIQAVYNACVEFIKWYNEQKVNLGKKQKKL